MGQILVVVPVLQRRALNFREVEKLVSVCTADE